jgi:hypothetical protein
VEIIATSSDFVKHSQSVNFQETTSVLIKFTIFIKRWLSKTTHEIESIITKYNRLTVRLSLISNYI